MATIDFQTAIHLAPSLLVDVLGELGADRCVGFEDVLSHGPVHAEPKRHRKVRLKYWRRVYEQAFPNPPPAEIDAVVDGLAEGYLTTEQLGSAAKHGLGDGYVVVWTAPTWEDRLFLWFAFEALTEAGVPAAQIATAEVRQPTGEDEVAEFVPLVEIDADACVAAFDDLFFPKGIYVEAGANLWQTFASVSPRQFAISIPHTTKFFPHLADLVESYGYLFPRWRKREPERLRLSELDEALLGALDAQVPRTWVEAMGAAIPFVSGIDDIVVLARLRDWVEQGAAVEAEVDEEVAFEDVAFCLTEQGQALLDRGADPAEKLPIFYVGDVRLYAGKCPWVKVVEGDHWWFERFPEES